VEAGTEAGDIPSFVPSAVTAAPAAGAGERGSAAPPIDGIDANSRRNAAVARPFLTTHPKETSQKTI